MALIFGADAGGIDETREAIQQWTSKPKLLDKHLARPPFAFVHSIIKNIILNTSYQGKLFSREELDISMIKSKADKIAWLQKVKDAVNKDLRMDMTLNLSKVCSGKEVENTRMFLQHFCRATKSFVDVLGAEQLKLDVAQTKFALGITDVDTAPENDAKPGPAEDPVTPSSKESRRSSSSRGKAETKQDETTVDIPRSTLEVEVAKSRTAIGAIISRPELTDKLMSRPPFTFLHAIIKGVLQATGYAQGLFSEEELNPKSITSKVAKMAFLEKIAVTSAKDLRKSVPVRYGKICAGKEVPKTHIFLQQVCEAAVLFQQKLREEEGSVESVASSATGNSEAEEKAGSRRRTRSKSRRASREVEAKMRPATAEDRRKAAAAKVLQKSWRRYSAVTRFKQLVENMFLTKLEVQEAIETAKETNSFEELEETLAASRSTLPAGHKLAIEAAALLRALKGEEDVLSTLRQAMADAETDGTKIPALLDAIREAERVVDNNHDLLVQARIMQATGLEKEAQHRLADHVAKFKAGSVTSASLAKMIQETQAVLDPRNKVLVEAKALATAPQSEDAHDGNLKELLAEVNTLHQKGQDADTFNAIDAARAYARKHLAPDSPTVSAMNSKIDRLLTDIACRQSNPKKYGKLLPDRGYTAVRFKDGPIGAGFGFRPEAWACVIVRFNNGKNQTLGQAEASGRLALGDAVVSVAGHDVRGQSWNYVKQIIKNSPRPLTMVFCKPFEWMTARLIELPHDFVTEEELATTQQALDLGDMGRTMGSYKPPKDWDEVANAPRVHRWVKGALKVSQVDQRVRKVLKCVLGSDGLFLTSTWHNPTDVLFSELQELAARTLVDAASSADANMYQKQHLVDVLGLHPQNNRSFEIVINKQGLPTRVYKSPPRQDDKGLLPHMLWSDAEDDYTYMCCMLLSMVALNRGFQGMMKSKVEEFEGKHRPAPVKSPMKIWKTLSQNNDGTITSPVAAVERDLMRCCASFSDPQDLLACYESIVAAFGDAVYIENQFSKGFDAKAMTGGFRAVVLNCVYAPAGLTWGKVLQASETKDIWGMWARSMESQLGSDMWELLSEFVDHGQTVLENCVGLASRPVKVIVEIKLTLSGYVEHLKKSAMWRTIAESESPSKLQGEYVRFARERQPTMQQVMAAKRAASKLKKRMAFGGLTKKHSSNLRQSFTGKGKAVLGE